MIWKTHSFKFFLILCTFTEKCVKQQAVSFCLYHNYQFNLDYCRHMTWKSIMIIYFLSSNYCTKYCNFQRNGKNMLNILSKTSTLTLTYDHVIWKVIENIYSLRATTVPSFETPRQRGQQILTGHYLNKDKHIDLWPSTIWPEDHWGTSFVWGQPHRVKLGNYREIWVRINGADNSCTKTNSFTTT